MAITPSLHNMNDKLTDEEKKAFEPMLHDTWAAIAPDAIDAIGYQPKKNEIIEMICDANRPEMFGGMSKEQYRRLSDCYNHPDTKRWLRAVLNY